MQPTLKGLLGIYIFFARGGHYRRTCPHLSIPAINVPFSHGSINTKIIYVAQDEAVLRTAAISAYRFHLPDLSSELLKHGLLLLVYSHRSKAFWDPVNRLLHCSRGLGLSIFIGRAGDDNGKLIGKVFRLGVDDFLQARCLLDDASDLNSPSFKELGIKPKDQMDLAYTLRDYRADIPGTPGNFEDILAKTPGEVSAAGEVIPVLEWFVERIGEKRSLEWNQWVTRTTVNSTFLNLGTWTTTENNNSKFFQRKSEKVWDDVYLEIRAEMGEKVIDGRKMFVVEFKAQPGRTTPLSLKSSATFPKIGKFFRAHSMPSNNLQKWFLNRHKPGALALASSFPHTTVETQQMPLNLPRKAVRSPCGVVSDELSIVELDFQPLCSTRGVKCVLSSIIAMSTILNEIDQVVLLSTFV